MHELAVTQSMLELVLSEAGKVKARKVTKINLVIGDMTGVIPDYVSFYFDFISKGTVAEGAGVNFTRKPTKARCPSCSKEFAVSGLNWVCPGCAGTQLQIVSGDELQLESIEVE